MHGKVAEELQSNDNYRRYENGLLKHDKFSYYGCARFPTEATITIRSRNLLYVSMLGLGSKKCVIIANRYVFQEMT